MKYARIENGRVLETTVDDPAGRYHPHIRWTPVPDEVEQNWYWREGVFVPESHYALQREWNYPPITDYMDGFAKSQSPDDALAAQGRAQMAAYAAACLGVKARFAKVAP